MSPRLSRAEQNDRNRALLLAAARRVFLERGYYAATLDQIADEAGFSKGAVYSRFASKADMFLALLEDRIAERAARTRSWPGSWPAPGTSPRCSTWPSGPSAARRAGGCWSPSSGSTPPGIPSSTAGTRPCTRRPSTGSRGFSPRSARRRQGLPLPPRQLAELWLAIETGRALEQIVDPDAFGGSGLPALHRLGDWFTGQQTPTQEGQ
jgi:Transcriptional regulator